MRKITAICPISDTLAALADDGTVWFYWIIPAGPEGGGREGWRPLPPLPEGEVVFTPAEVSRETPDDQPA